MKLKTFVIGSNSDNARHYSISLINPLAGMRLGMKLMKILSTSLENVDTEGLFNDFASLDVVDENLVIRKVIELLVRVLPNIDIDTLMDLLIMIVNKSSIKAKADSDNETETIRNEQDINKWFSKYRGDMFIFSAQVLAKNASPFLPEDWKGLIINKAQA